MHPVLYMVVYSVMWPFLVFTLAKEEASRYRCEWVDFLLFRDELEADELARLVRGCEELSSVDCSEKKSAEECLSVLRQRLSELELTMQRRRMFLRRKSLSESWRDPA